MPFRNCLILSLAVSSKHSPHSFDLLPTRSHETTLSTVYGYVRKSFPLLPKLYDDIGHIQKEPPSPAKPSRACTSDNESPQATATERDSRGMLFLSKTVLPAGPRFEDNLPYPLPQHIVSTSVKGIPPLRYSLLWLPGGEGLLRPCQRACW